jgi:CRP-like cAMP-binding protein
MTNSKNMRDNAARYVELPTPPAVALPQVHAFINADHRAVAKAPDRVIENRLLGCIPAPALALLAPHFKPIPLNQGAVLHEPETPIETAYFPLSGAVLLLAVMKGGEAIETAIVGHEGAIGLIGHMGSWQARTRAIVQVSGIANAISVAVLRNVVLQSEPIRDLIVRYKETLLQQTQQMVACNALHTVEERVARWLLEVSDRINSTELPATQDILGQVLGVRRTTVTLVAQKLQQKGLIRYRRGRILIRRPDALRTVACECYNVNRRASLASSLKAY